MRRFGVRIPTRARSRAKASTKVEAFFYGQVGTPSLLEREGLVIKKANAVRWALVLQDLTVGESSAQRGNPVKLIVKFSVFVNFADVASFEGRSAIGKRIAGTLVKCFFG